MWLEATSHPQSIINTSRSNSVPAVNKRRALTLAKEGQYGKAVQALDSLGIALPDDLSALNELIARHPVEKQPALDSESPPSLTVVESQVRAAITRFPKGTSPGASQLRAQHLYDAICGTTTPASHDCLTALTKWINLLLLGRLNSLISPWMCGAPLTALIKQGGKGVRPIAVGEMISRLVSNLCCSSVHALLPDIFIPEGQLGVGVRGGLEAAIHACRYTISQLCHKEDLCMLKVDFKNAFNECDRDTFLSHLKLELPELFSWVQWCYSNPPQLRFGQHALHSTSGVQQGDPLGPLLFALTLSELLKIIYIPEDIPMNIWYLDDGTLIGPRVVLADILARIQSQGAQFGLLLNKNKCEVYWPSGSPEFIEFPTEVTRLREGVTLLGSPVYGTPQYMSSCVAQLVNKTEALQEKICDLEDPQVELHLLRSCAGIFKINHILRTVPQHVMDEPLGRFDAALRCSLSKIAHSPIPDMAWKQAQLPFRLGGIGLRAASTTASIAFLVSCHASRPLLRKLLPSINTNAIKLPGEEEAEEAVLHKYELDVEDEMKQSSLQAQLDSNCYRALISGSNIRDRARLTAIAESTETSGWLRAVPIDSLGLTMAGPEFIISLRVWLGIDIFPTSPASLCACKTVIDPKGDHLLGCGYGPLRTRRHNALCNIIWHTLLQDNAQAKCEQGISGDTQIRPGDIYHPDFSHGQPTYFDLSVKNTFQLSSINQASTSAGAAALEGEMRKDDKYEAIVGREGAVFVPLVVETLGVWTPFAKRTLKSIAARTTIKNGLSSASAYRNLIMQLSTKLFSFNAKMMLNHLSVTQDDFWEIT